MRWSVDASRIDEGRFVCAANRNHKECLRDHTIFEDLHLPLTLSYRLIFKDFVKQISISTAAFMYNIDTRTMAQSYNFARRIIHENMEMNWEQEPMDKILERELQ
jgi:hypothetical protein